MIMYYISLLELTCITAVLPISLLASFEKIMTFYNLLFIALEDPDYEY